MGVMDNASRIDHASMFLADVSMVWWRRIYVDVEKGHYTITTWDDFKRELKKQFYLESTAHEARARLKRLTQRRTIHEYVKKFPEVLLEIPNYPAGEALFTFMDGLQS